MSISTASLNIVFVFFKKKIKFLNNALQQVPVYKKFTLKFYLFIAFYYLVIIPYKERTTDMA